MLILSSFLFFYKIKQMKILLSDIVYDSFYLNQANLKSGDSRFLFLESFHKILILLLQSGFLFFILVTVTGVKSSMISSCYKVYVFSARSKFWIKH